MDSRAASSKAGVHSAARHRTTSPRAGFHPAWSPAHRPRRRGRPKKLANQNVLKVLLSRFKVRTSPSGGSPLVTRRGPNSKPRKEHPEPETATWRVLASGCMVSSTHVRGRSRSTPAALFAPPQGQGRSSNRASKCTLAPRPINLRLTSMSRFARHERA